MHQPQNIKVFVRCRPAKPIERQPVLDIVPQKNEIKVIDRNSSGNRSFYYDQVFSSEATQDQVYQAVVQPLIDQVLLGFNCTVFAYGQTGTGKTYTMEGGDRSEDLSWEEDPHCGIIPRAINQLLDTLMKRDKNFIVRVSFLELYNEDTYDLLSPINDTTKLRIFEDSQKKGSVVVNNLEEISVQSKDEIYEILKRGSAKRQTAATLLNACSSRSHTIFSITVQLNECSTPGEELIKTGKLNLVDLAGSENIRRSGAQDKRAREAGNINMSLLTLGRVITALVEKRTHIPYRESKLTRLLQDSLGGKMKTSIIATISPGALDIEDTLSTLDYASRAKKITNKPEMNQKILKKDLLRDLANQINRLQKDLRAAREKDGIYIAGENYADMQKKLAATQELEDRLKNLQKEYEKSQRMFEVNKEVNKKLNSQATQLFKVVETATSDIHLLHSKNERIQNVMKENRATIDTCHHELGSGLGRIPTMVEMYAQDICGVVNSFHDETRRNFESNVEAVSRVASTDKILIENLVSATQSVKGQVDSLKFEKANIIRSIERTFDKRIESLEKIASQLEEQTDSLKNRETALGLVHDAMLKFNSNAQESADRIGPLASTLSSFVKRECASSLQKIDRLFKRELKDDVQTGLTPQKKNYEVPKRLNLTPTCKGILEVDPEECDTGEEERD